MNTPPIMSAPDHAHGLPTHGGPGVVSHNYSPSPAGRRRLQAVAVATLTGALLCSAALQMVGSGRPLDEPLGNMLREAGGTLKQWQAQLTRGLQVSLRAVADGRDRLPEEPVARTTAALHQAGCASAASTTATGSGRCSR